MPRDNWIFLWTVVYVAVFAACVGGYLLWQIKRRGDRTPVAFKLLRGPGESLRRRVAKFEEDLARNLLIAALGPPFAGATVFLGAARLFPQYPALAWGGLGVGALIFFGGTLWTFREAKLRLMRYRDDQLG